MFTLPDLPYSYSALEPYIDRRTMEIHHDKHHAGYVKNLNSVLPDGKDSELPGILSRPGNLPEDIRQKVINHGGGTYNHSLFWTYMSPVQNPAGDKLKAALTDTFGNPDAFIEKFSAVARSHFGSGWTWLVMTPQGLSITETDNQDCPLSIGQTPLLGIDIWEHSYYLKYQNRRADYVDAWVKIINWSQVEVNFLKAAGH